MRRRLEQGSHDVVVPGANGELVASDQVVRSEGRIRTFRLRLFDLRSVLGVKCLLY